MRYCVFSGSNPGRRPEYTAAAAALGTLLAARNIGLVYGGASVGLMGVVADAVLAAGGEVIGVIPQALADKEVAHTGLSNLRITGSMHERKALMAELSDGFIAMPGGLGTLEEIFEVWTWAQLGFHRKPCALLNVAGFYDGLATFLQSVAAEGFFRVQDLALLIREPEAASLLDRMATYRAPALPRKWVEHPEQT